MALYDYHCSECGQDRLVSRSITSEELIYCDDCDVEMRKKYTPTPAHFKGEGFYTTDKFTNR